MATNATIGLGLLVEMSTPAAPTTWVTIAECFKASPPSDADDQIDSTHFQSPGRRREYIAGFTDGGDVSFEMNYVPGSVTDLFLIAAQGLLRNIRLTYPNGVIVQFQGFRKSYQPDPALDDRMTSTATFKVTGTVSQTAAGVPVVVAGLGPSISGTLTVTSVLTVNEGQYSPAATSFTYQWRRTGTNIAGEINKTHTIVAGDQTFGLDCVVTPSNTTGAGAAQTSPRTAVIP
jgi:Lambda phage tail tube protein, TTP